MADDEAEVVFYSDNIESDDDDRVGLTFEDKTIIFFFEKDKDFPSCVEMSSPEEFFYGVFTPYDPDTQTYGLTLEQGDEKETLSDIAFSKEIFTQYKYDDELTPSQNLRMRNLYIAASIYTNLDEFFNSDDTLQASRGLLSSIFKAVARIFFPPPVANIVAGVITAAYGAVNFMSSNPVTMMGGLSSLYDGTKLIADGINQVLNVAVTGVSLNKTSVILAVGDTTPLSPTITPSNASNKSVSWSSGNTAVATVSTNGTVTGIAKGSAIITVTTANGGKKATCTVSVTNANVTFSGVTADGSAFQTTTQLTLTFSQAITGLTANDITLSGVSGVTKGTLSGSGPVYTLPITVITGGTLSVAVAKSGYTISGSPKTVNIFYNILSSVGIVINLSGMDEWELTGQTAEATPNVNKTFTVTGTYAAYRWYLDGVSVGTSSNYTFNKPVGVYELVVVVTNSNGESRSGRCRVSVVQK